MIKPIKLAIFASGNGTNAANIITYFSNHKHIQVKKIFSNNPVARVHEMGQKQGIPSTTFTKNEFKDIFFLNQLADIDFVILAGFLWLLPPYLVKVFPNKIINVHPALLPKFGGKGMYGYHVHESVLKSGDSHSGITIHLVNENYDEGRILFQVKCTIQANETPDTLANKIHSLEKKYFSNIIEKYIQTIIT